MEVLKSSIPVDYNGGEYFELGKVLVINANEDTFTDTMKRYLSAIVFKFYIETENSEYISVEGSTIKWDSDADIAYMLSQHCIPKDAYLGFSIILDKSVLTLKDNEGKLIYPDAKNITEFPIEIIMI